MRVDAKISARQWILNAIQNHSCIPNKETEREIRKFIGRLQRDLKQLERTRNLFLAVNSDDPEIRREATRRLDRENQPATKRKRRKLRKRNRELVRLAKEQRADANDRKLRFEYAILKR